jgi:hypothetical protein
MESCKEFHGQVVCRIRQISFCIIPGTDYMAFPCFVLSFTFQISRKYSQISP